MPDWFYAPVSLQEETVRLDGPEAHHMTRVLRLESGARVTLFDGAGTEAAAEITAARKRDVELRILDRRAHPEPRSPVILATAVPKGDRFRWLVEKATELGVARLIPIETTRSVVEPGAGKLDKMRQTVIAACKQSHRSRLMEIEPIRNWADVVRTEIPGRAALVADPAGEPLARGGLAEQSDSPILLVIGPEGGLSDEEVTAAVEAGARSVHLGPQILRIETAAVALAGFVRLASPTVC